MTNYSVRLTSAAVRHLVEQPAAVTSRLGAGLCRRDHTVELLVASTDPRRFNRAEDEALVLATVRDRPDGWDSVVRDLLARATEARTFTAALVLGRGAASGCLAAVCRTPSGVRSLASATVVGAGMPRIDLSARDVTREEVERIRANQPIEAADLERWSRTIGALGRQAWRHLRRQHIGVIGCGRSGSLVAQALARGGVRRITLIDPDCVELHNLGEMDAVDQADCGRAKVEGIAASLRRYGRSEIATVAAGIDTLTAFRIATTVDILVGCADDGAARLLTSAIGAAYLRPVIDIGTGVFGEGDERRMGGDVRLLLPGACIACFGGLAGRQTESDPTPGSPNAEPDWRRQRAGSLRSVNQIAVGFGLRLLEDLVQGRIGTSAWLHLEFGRDGMPRLDRVRPTAREGCRVCALMGRGDAALRALPDVIRQTESSMRARRVR